MARCRIVFLFVVAAGSMSSAFAQSSKLELSGRSAPDPVKSSVQPLTPKSPSAISRKASVAVPTASTRNRATDAELNRLERQGIKTGSSNRGRTGTVQHSLKSSVTSSGSGSGINASYQAPYIPHR